jgi:hypothetical protein
MQLVHVAAQALLRRVFQTAAELWQEEVGALLHTRNYQLLGEAFRTWQLHVLEQQEHRRQQILWNAAAAFRQVGCRILMAVPTQWGLLFACAIGHAGDA